MENREIVINDKTKKIAIIIVGVVIFLAIALIFIYSRKNKKTTKEQVPEYEVVEETPKQTERSIRTDTGGDIDTIFDMYLSQKITARDAMAQSGLSCGTFYRKLKKYNESRKSDV
jgi:flagellar basal body-associated protein FliL